MRKNESGTTEKSQCTNPFGADIWCSACGCPEDADVRLGHLGKTFELLKNNIFVEILGTIMNHKNCWWIINKYRSDKNTDLMLCLRVRASPRSLALLRSVSDWASSWPCFDSNWALAFLFGTQGTTLHSSSVGNRRLFLTDVTIIKINKKFKKNSSKRKSHIVTVAISRKKAVWLIKPEKETRTETEKKDLQA